MIVGLRFERPLRAWHICLAERLQAKGHSVQLDPQPRVRSRPGVAAILRAERVIYGARSLLFTEFGGRTTPLRDATPEVMIELTDGASSCSLCLAPSFDGERGEEALLDSLLARRSPVIAIDTMRGEETRRMETALPAIESPDVLARSLDHVLLRLVSLLSRAVDDVAGVARGLPAADPNETARFVASPPGFVARGLMRALYRKWGPAKGRPNHWQIAIRSRGRDETSWSPDRIGALIDDDAHFYADPFPFEAHSRRVLFFEDYPYATGKGVIAAVDLDEEGRPGPKQTVLETPVHLSYPLVLRHGDRIYMLPEMSGARVVQLFRADPFPDRWIPDRVLIENAVLGDATPIFHNGSWWMFASLAGDGGSTWDQLALYHAPDLLGPWAPHPANPVLIDAGAARPAGAMWHENGVLMRVAQDCRTGYGIGLAICRVDRLDDLGYTQTVVRRIGPPAGFGADGIHTWNRSETLEVIDLRIPHTSRSRRA